MIIEPAEQRHGVPPESDLLLALPERRFKKVGIERFPTAPRKCNLSLMPLNSLASSCQQEKRNPLFLEERNQYRGGPQVRLGKNSSGPGLDRPL